MLWDVHRTRWPSPIPPLTCSVTASAKLHNFFQSQLTHKKDLKKKQPGLQGPLAVLVETPKCILVVLCFHKICQKYELLASADDEHFCFYITTPLLNLSHRSIGDTPFAFTDLPSFSLTVPKLYKLRSHFPDLVPRWYCRNPEEDSKFLHQHSSCRRWSRKDVED